MRFKIEQDNQREKAKKILLSLDKKHVVFNQVQTTNNIYHASFSYDLMPYAKEFHVYYSRKHQRKVLTVKNSGDILLQHDYNIENIDNLEEELQYLNILEGCSEDLLELLRSCVIMFRQLETDLLIFKDYWRV